MTSNYFQQYIAGYTVAKFWCYLIRSGITKANALEHTDKVSLQYVGEGVQ